jgi:hypothetical protein
MNEYVDKPPVSVEVDPALLEHAPILANLLELYAHDFSEFHIWVSVAVQYPDPAPQVPALTRDNRACPARSRVAKQFGFFFV